MPFSQNLVVCDSDHVHGLASPSSIPAQRDTQIESAWKRDRDVVSVMLCNEKNKTYM